MFTRKYNECQAAFISFNRGACIRIAGFRVRHATEGYEVITSDHGSRVIQIDPFVCQANGPNSADKVSQIGIPVPGFHVPAVAPQQLVYFPPAPAPAPGPPVPPAPAPAPGPPVPAPAVPGFNVPAPAPGPPVPAPAVLSLEDMRNKRLEMLTPTTDNNRKRSHESSFASSSSQESLLSLSSIESAGDSPGLANLLSTSGASDLNSLLALMVSKELAKLLHAPEPGAPSPKKKKFE